jgi:hypothetical protein
VAQQDVHFLYSGGEEGGDGEQRVGHVPQAASGFSGKCRGGDFHGVRLLQRPNYVWTVSGSGDSDGDVAGAAEGLDLAGENGFKAEIVGAGGQDRGIRGESDGGEGTAVGDEPHSQFGGEMLGVGGAASIAEEQKFATLLESVNGQVDEALQWFGTAQFDLCQEGSMIVKTILKDSCCGMAAQNIHKSLTIVSYIAEAGAEIESMM